MYELLGGRVRLNMLDVQMPRNLLYSETNRKDFTNMTSFIDQKLTQGFRMKHGPTPNPHFCTLLAHTAF